MKKAVIIIGSLAVLGVGGYIAYRFANRATSAQFDSLVNTLNSKGSDTFSGLGSAKMDELRRNFTKKLSKKNAQELIRISSISEKNMTPNQKEVFKNLFSKIIGSSIGS